MTKIPEYDYMNIFSNQFFDVDKIENKIVKDIVNQVDIVISSIIVKFGEIVNELEYLNEGKAQEGENSDVARTRLVIISFIRKIMEQMDAINILYSKCSFTQAEVILRSMVENVVALEFVLKEDTDLRAAAYFLEHHFQEQDKAEDLLGKDSVLKSDIPKDELNKMKSVWNKKEHALKNLVKKNSLYRQVDTNRKAALSNRKSKKYNWYEIGGCQNFRELMKAVGLGKYYTGIYGSLSFETHALNASTEMRFEEDCSVYVNMIRSPHNGSSTFSLTCTFAISALNKLYEYLGDGMEEKEEFRNFFEEYMKQRDNVVFNLNKIVLKK